MIGNSLITQIIVAGLAISIIVTYIQPAIGNIGELQDKKEKTTKELDRVNEVKNKLNALVAQTAAISPTNKQALSVYMPEEFDEVSVMKDLEAITKKANVKLSNLVYIGKNVLSVESKEQNETTAELPLAHDFSLTINCSYEQMKYLLLLLESNNYPLDIQNLSIKPTDGGLLDMSLDVRTYSYK